MRRSETAVFIEFQIVLRIYEFGDCIDVVQIHTNRLGD